MWKIRQNGRFRIAVGGLRDTISIGQDQKSRSKENKSSFVSRIMQFVIAAYYPKLLFCRHVAEVWAGC